MGFYRRLGLPFSSRLSTRVNLHFSSRKTIATTLQYYSNGCLSTDESNEERALVLGIMGKSKFYAVANGRTTGVFGSWAECEKQVKHFKGAKFKSFPTQQEAQAFVQSGGQQQQQSPSLTQSTAHGTGTKKTNTTRTAAAAEAVGTKKRSRATNNDNHHEQQQQQQQQQQNLFMATRQIMDQKKIKLDDGCSFWNVSIMFDGGSRGNPGMAGAGAFVTIVSSLPSSSLNQQDGKQQSITKSTTASDEATNAIEFSTKKIRVRRFMDGATNNEAEYTGIIVGLEATLQEIRNKFLSTKTTTAKESSSSSLTSPSSGSVKDKLHAHLVVQGDSQLVIKQIKKEYRCKHPPLQVLLAQVRSLTEELSRVCTLIKVDYEHVLREFNSVADGLANQAMDARRSWTTTTDDDDVEEKE